MSFILDALKKSERERQRQTGPALFEVKVAPPRNRFPLWAVVIGALLVVNSGVIVWLLLHKSSKAGQTASTQSAPMGGVLDRWNGSSGERANGPYDGNAPNGGNGSPYPGNGQYPGGPQNGADGSQYGGNSQNGAYNSQYPGNSQNGGNNAQYPGGPQNSAYNPQYPGSSQNGADGSRYSGNPQNGGNSSQYSGNPQNGGNNAQYSGGPQNSGNAQYSGNPQGGAYNSQFPGNNTGAQNSGANPPPPSSGGGGEYFGDPTGAYQAQNAEPRLKQSAADDEVLNPDDYEPAAEQPRSSRSASARKPKPASSGEPKSEPKSDDSAEKPEERAARKAEKGLPSYQDAAAMPGMNMPPLRLDLHVFDPEPAKSFVLVNMQKVKSGDTIAQGVHVDQITPSGAIMTYRGVRFLLHSE